jgi:hypothetical protein
MQRIGELFDLTFHVGRIDAASDDTVVLLMEVGFSAARDRPVRVVARPGAHHRARGPDLPQRGLPQDTAALLATLSPS